MARNKPTVEFDFAVICDDIRKEDNGKLILIGVYSGNILVGGFPGKLALATWLHGYGHELEEVDIEIRYQFVADESEEKPYIVGAQGKITVVNTKDEVSVPLPRMPVVFAGPGLLSVDYRLGGGRWKNLLEKRVLLGVPPNESG